MSGKRNGYPAWTRTKATDMFMSKLREHIDDLDLLLSLTQLLIRSIKSDDGMKFLQERRKSGAARLLLCFMRQLERHLPDGSKPEVLQCMLHQLLLASVDAMGHRCPRHPGTGKRMFDKEYAPGAK